MKDDLSAASEDHKQLAKRCVELASECSERTVAEALRALAVDYLRRAAKLRRRGSIETNVGHLARSEKCRLCCKSILSISARNIDSRSGWNAQQRFKRTGAPIRLLQISISQSPLGDFCNTICQ